MQRYLCFDIGAGSGRGLLAGFNGNSLTVSEFSRFSSSAVRTSRGVYWDVLSIVENIKKTIIEAKTQGNDIHSIGIDCFGVDFGLISKSGELLGNPMCDMDPRTAGILESTGSLWNAADLYKQTGAQIYEMTTLFQLAALKRQGNEALEIAAKFLMMPDVLNYMLTGETHAEFTVSSTSNLLKLGLLEWNTELIERFGLNRKMFLDPVLPGKVKNRLSGMIRDELGIEGVDVVTVAGHDTASAVAALPDTGGDSIFISSGTWSIVGAVTDKPVIDMRFAGILSNEGCHDGKNRLIKNLLGMKFLQELKSVWAREGRDISYALMDEAMEHTKPFTSLIDPENMAYFSGTNMPQLMIDYCVRTAQPVPESVGEFVRAANESLALSYRESIEQIELACGRKFKSIYILGGGVQNRHLCQMTADATRKPVYAWYKESAAFGNALIQACAAGNLSPGEMATCAAASHKSTEFVPGKPGIWDDQYDRFLKLKKKWSS
jgi:sugar (pentulose or hexulose) kinase